MGDRTAFDPDRADSAPPAHTLGSAPTPPPYPSVPGWTGDSPYRIPSEFSDSADPGSSDQPVRDPKAVASLVCSILGIFIGLSAVLGIIFGFVARSRIRASEGTRRGKELALAGIVIGFVALAANIAIVTVVLLPRSTPAPTASYNVFGGNPTAADAALAKSEALPTSAYPAGFVAGGASSTTPCGSFYGCYDDAQARGIAACLGTSTTHVDTNPAEYAGQTYQDQNGDSVAEDVEVYPNQDDAAADVTALARPNAARCWLQLSPEIRSAFASGAGRGATVGTASAHALRVPVVGDHSAGVGEVIPMTVQGVSGAGYFDLVAIQKGRSEAVLFVNGVIAPPGAGRIADLARIAAAELSN